MLNKKTLTPYFKDFKTKKPFSHCVIDNFFPLELAKALSAEFPDFDDPKWHQYNNQIEIKKVSNNWNVFPKTTYETFTYLNSPECTELLSELTGIDCCILILD